MEGENVGRDGWNWWGLGVVWKASAEETPGMHGCDLREDS